ncbi:hypothetical protein SEA_PRAIRIE_22 [Arthrobacter phage Prairie]|uniref:Minor tail protein n=1 Tax=Arthrobacter phage Prairie TaxID=2816463 RepID=A0A8A5LML0_9CAUD|nr:hypothetical protein SEA_PRAIRIE_22 [Arthrobacter phage Prairie]
MIYRGRVVETLPGQRAWVIVPPLGGQDPIEVPVVPYDLSPGEGVLVGDLSTRGADLVVLGRENELQRFPEWGELVGVPAEFPPAPHGHAWGEISGKPASYPPSAHGHTWGEISGAPATYPPSAHTHDWATGITGKPSTFAPSAHTHLWADLTDKPATFSPSAHTHPATGISDSTATGRALLTAADAAAARAAAGLDRVNNTNDAEKPISTATQQALNAKSDTSHTHSYSSVAGLDPTPIAVTFANGWTNFNSTAYSAMKSVRSAPGSVTLAGMPKPGTIAEGVVLASVHADHRPAKDAYMACVARTSVPSNIACLLVVRAANGNVEVFGAPSTTSYLCIGLSYVLANG